jgi:hypothetical protein
VVLRAILSREDARRRAKWPDFYNENLGGDLLGTSQGSATLWVVGVLTVRARFDLPIEPLYQLPHPVGDFLAQHVRIELS